MDKFSFMEEWGTYKLSEISSFKTGKLDSNASCEGGKYPFFTCSPETLSINQYAFDQKAILLAGNNAEGNFNVKYYEGKFNAYQRTYVFTANEKKVIPYFLFYALKICLNDFKQMSQGTSTKFLTAKILNSFEVKLPPISIQAKIVNLLRSIDEKVALNNRINHNLEEQAQALYKSWFDDFKPFKGGKFVNSEKGLIPEGWHVGTLSELAKITMGQSPSGSSFNEEGNGIIFYQGRTEFGFRFPSIKLFTTEPTRYSAPRSILISVRAPVGDINVSRKRCCIGRGLASIEPFTESYSFVLYTVKNQAEELDMYNGEGTVFGSINRKELEGLSVIVPPKDIIISFNELVTPLDTKIEELSDEIDNLQIERDTLLPQLMSGSLTC